MDRPAFELREPPEPQRVLGCLDRHVTTRYDRPVRAAILPVIAFYVIAFYKEAMARNGLTIVSEFLSPDYHV